MLRTRFYALMGLVLLIASVGHAGVSPFIEEEVLAVPRPWDDNGENTESDVCLALDPDGLPHIVFHMPGRAVYHAVRTNLGWTMEVLDSVPAATPDSSLNYGKRCRIAFDAQGMAHAVYAHFGYYPPDTPARWRQIMYRRQTQAGIGAPWTPVEQTYPLHGFVSMGTEMSLAVSPDGSRVFLAASLLSSSPAVIYQERVGGVWSTPFNPAFPYSSSRPNLALTPDGNPWVSCNDGVSIGDLIVARRVGATWDEEPAAPSDIATNPDARLAALGAAGDDLQMCYEAKPNRVGFSARKDGVWRVVISGEDAGPIIPTFGRLRLGTGPGGWAPWILSSRGNGGFSNGALLSATSIIEPNEWSTFEVTDVVSVNGSAWIAVGPGNRVHVVFQVRDNSEGVPGMRLRYAVFDAPSPPLLAVERQGSAPGLSLAIVPDLVRAGEAVAVRLAVASVGRVVLSVHDVAGRARGSRTVDAIAPGGATLSWNLGALEPGVYFMRARSGQASVTRRFVTLP